MNRRFIFIPKITENVDDCVNFSENVSQGLREVEPSIFLIDVINPTKNSILLTKGDNNW